MRRYAEKLRRVIAKLPRAVTVLPLAAALLLPCAGILWLAASLKYVTVRDTRGAERILLTAASEPQTIINEAGFFTGFHDRVVYRRAGGTAEILIHRAFTVTVEADGEQTALQVMGGTVADLLAKGTVELKGEDFAEPAPETVLTPGMTVQIKRVSYAEDVRREVLEPAYVDAYRLTLPEGSEFVESNNATYDVRRRSRLVNGEADSSEVVELVPVVTPRRADSYTITEGVPCSRISGFDDIEMGPDALPVNYTSLMEGAVCTAYSSSGGKGASGLGLYCGTAAVNPNVIPYGTRMYITSADGKFVYGFCIATDTGGAMMEGYVDLDLYFETNAECMQFGKRGMNVYILD